MSEEILKALMELFALIVKQDGGILISEREYVAGFLNKQLTKEAVEEYISLFDEHSGPVIEGITVKTQVTPSVRDSVKILGICKKINRTLNQEQKVVVLMRLYELVNADRQFTPQRMNIINTVAEVFKIQSDEVTSIEQIVKSESSGDIDNPAILVLSPEDERCELCRKMATGYSGTKIHVLNVASVDLYFLKYFDGDQLYLNGLPISPEIVYTLAKGSSLRSQQGHSIYYSDISSFFKSDVNIQKVSLTVEQLSLHFKKGQRAVENINFSVDEGKLIGILGASGSGKTTLLNLMSGIQKPTSGRVIINGLNVYEDSKSLEGIFGYVPQDDLLVEDLTVFENLYFAARQCFGDKTKKEICELVDKTLTNLGLFEKKNLKVGSAFNKVISGGQRKRLNIALELIREPLVLFLDEPTSGLSSRDSENLMDLLRDLTLKGKLIFTVIHQPSSEIFKMFDKVVILDQGGVMAYYGNPIDSVVYFKTLDTQINSNMGECPSCGNVNPEIIFNIIETKVVDEFGQYTEKRKVKPDEWANAYNSSHTFEKVQEIKETLLKSFNRPDAIKQFFIYFLRDIKSKIANRQYILLTLLEAPILGFVLSYIIRYIPDPDSDIYIFAENENIPIYIFMSIIVALFLGLTISAEEIFRDRKILKRERFLNLNRNSYLLSKTAILIIISAIQTTLFIIIANPILGIKGMYPYYWIAFFTTAFCANMIGLNISASFNSAVTIYIIIPLLIIPMMVLSGAMFPFDKLNRKIGNVDKVPMIAELMPTRWTYEALIVSQFKDNRYSKINYTKNNDTYYSIQKKISVAEFSKIYRIKELRNALEKIINEYSIYNCDNKVTKQIYSEASINIMSGNLKLIRTELQKLALTAKMREFKYLDDLTPNNFSMTLGDSLTAYIDRIDKKFNKISNNANDIKDAFYNMNSEILKRMENDYYNYKLLEIVTKPYERNKILVYNHLLIQNSDQIYLDPDKKGFFDFRTHFYAPSKYIFGIKTDTFVFNISLILTSVLLLYLALYYEIIGKLVTFFENLKLRK